MHRIIILTILCASHLFSAEFTFDDILKLPPMPSEFEQLESSVRVNWLKIKISELGSGEASKLERYQLKRQLFGDLYYLKQLDSAKAICMQVPPLLDDFEYRRLCVDTIYKDYNEYIDAMLEIVRASKAKNSLSEAASALLDVGWRQSEEGDIAESFASYEDAISIVPKENKWLLHNAMLDTATVYVVHGGKQYIKKGRGLRLNSLARGS